jgi:lipopolysaccharide export system permease protein
MISGFTSFIKKLENKGLSTTRWIVNKHYKTAFACIPLIMIIFGLALTIQKPKSSHALGIGLSIIVIFMYYALIIFGKTLGYNSILPPLLSVWSVNFIFLSIGTFIYFRART